MFFTVAVQNKCFFFFFLLVCVQGSSLFISHPSYPPASFSSSFPLSVQQRAGEHEDPAAEPDGPDGELGAPAHRLPPARHQLHGVLQLGEARRRRREDLHQDRRPEDGE